MPSALLSAHVVEMPRLVAEESLQAAARVAVGSGTLKKGKASQLQRNWQRQTASRPPVIRPASRDGYAVQMAGLGIGVRKVPRDG